MIYERHRAKGEEALISVDRAPSLRESYRSTLIDKRRSVNGMMQIKVSVRPVIRSGRSYKAENQMSPGEFGDRTVNGKRPSVPLGPGCG